MTALVMKPCSGCSILIPLSVRRCSGCEAQRQVQLAARRDTTTQRGLGAQYQRARRRILANSNLCWICGKPEATTADHLTPRSRGGDNSDANLRPAHARCNASHRQRDRDARHGSSIKPISSEARALDGKRVSVGLIDEVMEHPDALVYDKRA
jgi:5-methylcytosine-specific restriction endonuclease McrA